MNSLKKLILSALVLSAFSPILVAQEVVIYRSGADITSITSSNDGLSFDAFLEDALKLKLKAQQEAQAKAQQEAQAKAQQEAQAKAQQEAQVKAQQEAQAKAQQEAQAKAQSNTPEGLSFILKRDKVAIDKKRRELEALRAKKENNGKDYEITTYFHGDRIELRLDKK